MAASSVPSDLWVVVCTQLQPCDIVACASVCHELRTATCSTTLWEEKLLDAARLAVCALAAPRGLKETTQGAWIGELAFRTGLQRENGTEELDTSLEALMERWSARAAFFIAMPHVATAAVAVLKQEAPQLCLVSLAQRAYDTTDFVHSHPGGAHHMLAHHGADATSVFDVFPHSMYAHDLMRDHMLRFDAVEYVGRYGAPAFARNSVPHRAWSVRREVKHSITELANDVTLICKRILHGALSSSATRRHTLHPVLTCNVLSVLILTLVTLGCGSAFSL
eukprot:CAMPEP_0115850588 /NCGR_PEP_ID=MMETSP0287-20121206/12042_1 /TAXON_ID=412157 /ORGANISM="Chrysochromulina rotalis, Strain UIO044" /LENGTH=278 /DNA_ID=CAMNT_0003304591 /DNA_START=21 /DNA_END=857 /DNA_ORIENTATION=-